MPDLDDLINDLSTMEGALQNLSSRFPSIIGKEAVDIIRENFTKQGYDSGKGIWKWRNRSPVTNRIYDYNRTSKFRTKTGRKSRAKNYYKGSVYSSKNPILVQTGNLKDSVSYRTFGNTTEVGVFPRIRNKVNSLEYAKIHNEGGQFKMFGKKLKNMPVRQFMPRPGDNANPKIIKKAEEKWQYEEAKIMAKFNGQ